MKQREKIARLIVAFLVLLAFAPMAAYSLRSRDGGARLSLSAPLPESVPQGAVLTVGDPETEAIVRHLGWDAHLPFRIVWTNISGGPQVTEAFHAKAIDLGAAANIPPINAVYVGMPVRIVAVSLREDPVHHPIYVLGGAPGANLHSLADLRGKTIAFSRGQAQGLVIVRALREAGLTPRDVTLLDLPEPKQGQVYRDALAARAVQVAVLPSGVLSEDYLAKYGPDGATVIPHGTFRDDPMILYVREETLRDPAKAAALRVYVGLWARALEWRRAHPDEWGRIYYMDRKGTSAEGARIMVESSGSPDLPTDWSAMIRYQQETIDLLAKETGRKPFDASTIFDRRFEKVVAEAIRQAPPREENASWRP